jgi:hypothetical protein
MDAARGNSAENDKNYILKHTYFSVKDENSIAEKYSDLRNNAV